MELLNGVTKHSLLHSTAFDGGFDEGAFYEEAFYELKKGDIWQTADPDDKIECL